MDSAESICSISRPAGVRHLHGSGSVPLAVIDGAGVVVAWTEGAEHLLGHSAQEVVGRPISDLVAGGCSDGAPRAAGVPRPTGAGDAGGPAPRRAPSTRGRGVRWICERTVAHRDGSTRRLRVEAHRLRGVRGRHWLLAAHEILPPFPGAPTTARERSRPEGTPEPPPAPEAGAGPPPLRNVMLDASPVGFSVWDADLRCVWRNSTAVEQGGGVRWDPDGAPPLRVAVRDFGPAEVEPVMRRVLEDGKPIIDHQFCRATPDGLPDRFFSVSLFRLDAADGAPLGVCTVALDISDSTVRRRLALLSGAGRRIGSTLDVMTTAQELAEAVVPGLADFVTVDLAESVALAEAPSRSSARSGGPYLLRAGLASVSPGAPEAVVPRGERVPLPATSPILATMRTGRSHMSSRLDARQGWLERDPARARIIHGARMHSGMSVPLMARGAALGVAVFARTTNPAPFTGDDLMLAEDLVSRASLNVDNARRYTRERGTALALQRNLLPGRLSGGPGADVAFRYLPTDRHDGVGGDWFDVVPLPRGRTAWVVGDVMGHGINAAASMGRMRTAVHTLAALDLAPAELLARLDALTVSLADQDERAECPGASVLLATCVYVVHDPARGMCTAARAGHPPPLLVRPGGGAAQLDAPTGTPIGLGLGSYESVDVPLPVGTVLALFTDGLVETRTEDIDDGLRRLAAVLEEEPPDDLGALCDRIVERMVPGGTAEDDAALLLARTKASGTR